MADYAAAIAHDDKSSLPFFDERPHLFRERRQHKSDCRVRRSAQTLTERCVPPICNSGLAEADAQQSDAAIADLDTQSLKLQPGQVDAYLNRGYAYLEKRDYDNAGADFDFTQ